MHEISRVVLSDVLSNICITILLLLLSTILPKPMNAIQFMPEISRVALLDVLSDVFITLIITEHYQNHAKASRSEIRFSATHLCEEFCEKLFVLLNKGDDLDLVKEDEGGERGEHVLLEDGRRRQNNVLDVLNAIRLVDLGQQLGVVDLNHLKSEKGIVISLLQFFVFVCHRRHLLSAKMISNCNPKSKPMLYH
jgi:hypothetical protein